MEVGRFLAFGARTRRVDAPASGDVLVPIVNVQAAGNGRVMVGDQVRIPFRQVPGRSWLIFPTTLKEYTLIVGGEPVTLRVPEDFDFEWTIRDAFFPNPDSHEPGARDLARAAVKPGALVPDANGNIFLRTGKRVNTGDRVLAFDILTGDQLFVDRFSYNFVRPHVGSGFVFRTGNIPGIASQFGDQYYIKRLVGVPGDTLEVKNFTLYRNHAPITGADAFDKNAHQQDRYPGYRNEGSLSAAGSTVTVEPHKYFAMGDNSANSADGRYWGFVPDKDVVGRPLFVYYPFTSHWGPAK
jgi:signal peptidase I